MGDDGRARMTVQRRAPSALPTVPIALDPFTVPIALPPALLAPRCGSADPPTEPIPAPGRRCGGLGAGLAMSMSAALGALAGVVGWLVAARMLPQAEVGLAAAVVAAFFLVSGVSRLNLGLGLMRWLPVAGRHAPRLVRRSVFVIMPLSGLVGLCYVLAVPELGRTAGGGSSTVGAVVFVLAAAGWAVFVVHDYVLVAVGRPWWTVGRNASFAAARIALLVILGSTLGAQGVVLSWAAPIVGWIVLDAFVLRIAVRRSARAARGGELPSRSEVVGFLGPTALAQIGNTLLVNQVPLLVILQVGPEPGAAFFLAWQGAVVLETAATYFTHSLSAGWARAPERGRELSATCLRQMLVIFLPLLAVGALLAGPALTLLGSGYAAAADVLRLLLLGQAFRLLVVHELGVRTASGRGAAYARLHLASTVLVLAAILLVPTGGPPETALLAVAWAYVAVQAACALHVGLTRALRRTR